VNTVVPALIAGDAVLLKQAAQTLLVGDRFQKALDTIVCRRACLRTLCWSTARPRRSSQTAT
jgi:acyl-CoA reductase-like NAD-dependent aldehyde dehydrogenase